MATAMCKAQSYAKVDDSKGISFDNNMIAIYKHKAVKIAFGR